MIPIRHVWEVNRKSNVSYFIRVFSRRISKFNSIWCCPRWNFVIAFSIRNPNTHGFCVMVNNSNRTQFWLSSIAVVNSSLLRWIRYYYYKCNVRDFKFHLHEKQFDLLEYLTFKLDFILEMKCSGPWNASLIRYIFTKQMRKCLT